MSKSKLPGFFIAPLHRITPLLLMSVIWAHGGNGTWNSDSSGNWSDTTKWAGGTVADAATFTADFSALNLTGSRTITLDSARTISGLKFGDATPDFNWTLAGASTLTLGASPSINVINQSATISTVIAGTAGLTKTGSGTLKLAGATETFTGGLRPNAGTLQLDYSASGSPASTLIPSQTLSLGGGTLQIIGASSGTAQSFANTAISTTSGLSTVTAAPVSGTIPTINLGTLTGAAGGMVRFDGAAYNSGASSGTTLGGTTVAATATYNVTANTINGGLIAYSTSGGAAGSYATVGLYDWAAVSGGTIGTAQAGSIVGASQLGAFYTTVSSPSTAATFGLNLDLTASATMFGNANVSAAYSTVRINAVGPITLTTCRALGASTMGGLLITPNVGPNNVTVAPNGSNAAFQASRSSGAATGLTVWQNNTQGELIISATYNNGTSSAATASYTQGGPGSVLLNAVNGYTGQSYLNGGFTVINANSGLGAVATGAAVNLNGGTLFANATFSLDNAGAAPFRAITLNGAGGTLAASAANTLTVRGVIGGTAPLTIGTGTIAGTGAGTANTTAIVGSGTVNLSGANTYSGNTLIQSGTLALAATGTLNNTPQIALATGTTFDVSAVTGYALGSSQSLTGSGTVNGSLASTAGGSTLIPGTLGAAGTLTFNNNLNLSNGGALYFDLSTSAASGNDKITVGGNLTSGGVIHINALSGAANLDTTADYILFQVAGTTSGTLPTLAWDGVAPANFANFVVAQSGNDIVLKFNSATAPTVTAAVNPSSLNRNEATTVTATVTPGSGNLASVTVNLTQIGGSSAATLVLSNNFIYTNTFTVSSSSTTGSKTLTVTVTDDTTPTPLTGSAILNLNLTATTRTWDGGSVANDHWTSGANWAGDAAPGLAGDSVTFAGTTRLTTDLDANHSVAGLTFDASAGSFTLGTVGSTLTLTSGGILNNSANAQTFNVPIILSAAQTFNATAGDLAFGQPINNSGNLLTLDGSANTAISAAVSGNGGLTKSGSGTLSLTGNNAYTGTTTVGGGILRVDTGGTVAGGAANISAVGGAQLHVNGGTLTASASGNVGAGSAGLLVSAGSASYNGGLTTDLGSANGYFINVAGGSLNAASLNLGRTAIYNTQPAAGSTTTGFYINGGAVNITGNLNMGTASAANSSVSTRLDSGSLTVGGVLTIGLNNSGRWSVVDVNGGTLTANDTTTGISVGGPFAGRALLQVRSGTASAGKITLGQGAIVSESVVNLTGGSLYVGSGGIVLGSSGVGHVATVNLAGGTLGASADWSSSLDLSLNGATIKAADAVNTAHNITLNGVVSGAALTKTGAGVLTLGGANTFSGNTTVSAGTLALGTAGSLNSSPIINVASGATFDVSGAASYTLGSTQTLKGEGTVTGPATLNGTLAPGNSIGTLTFNTAPTLLGTTLMEISAPNSSDQVNVTSGTLNLGGTLTVTSVGAALQIGDTFDLFNGTLSGAFATMNLPHGNAHWITGNLNIDGSIIFTNTAPVALNITAGATPGGSVTFAVIGGKFSPADPEGDSLTVTGVSTPTSGSASFTSTSLTYVADGATGTNTFTYTVTDAFGATDTKTVNVIVSAPQGFNLLSGPVNNGNGTMSISYLGIPGANYALDTTASLAPPITWTPVSTQAAAANGTLTFTFPTGDGQGFFRTRSVP